MSLQENGRGALRKYRSMNSDVSQDEDVCVSYPFEENGIIRNRSSSNYVMACSIFASLNSVLLGYGWCIASFLTINHNSSSQLFAPFCKLSLSAYFFILCDEI